MATSAIISGKQTSDTLKLSNSSVQNVESFMLVEVSGDNVACKDILYVRTLRTKNSTLTAGRIQCGEMALDRSVLNLSKAENQLTNLILTDPIRSIIPAARQVIPICLTTFLPVYLPFQEKAPHHK